MKLYKIFYAIVLLMASLHCTAQIGFGTNNPSSAAVVEIASTGKGVLIPRVHLLSVKDTVTILKPADALTVYNFSIQNGLKKGFYYFSVAQQRWIDFGDEGLQITGNLKTDENLNFLGTGDDVDLVFRRGNVRAGLLNAASKNTSFGVGALNPATSGKDNTAAGFNALAKNTSGNDNAALGAYTLENNETGSSNIAAGYQSLNHNISGNDNIGVGAFSLFSNTTGNDNIALGHETLRNNRTGIQNIAAGYQSLYSNSSGNDNVAAGHQALYHNVNGNENLAIGSESLISNTSGSNNTSIGVKALYRNETGSGNFASGTESLFKNNANNNTAIGHQSLYNNVAGSNNTAIGYKAGYNLRSGNYNLAIGDSTLFQSETDSYQLNIANSIYGQNLNGSSGKVGIGVTVPNSTLQVLGSLSAKIREIGGGTVGENDHTLLVNGPIELPAPSVENRGKIYYIINNTKNQSIISCPNGLLKQNGEELETFTMGRDSGTKGLTVQSIVTHWLIINKY